jgi:hypothetical protein
MRKKLLFFSPLLVILFALTFLGKTTFSQPEIPQDMDLVKIRTTPSTQVQIETLKRFAPYQVSEIPPSKINRSYDYEIPVEELDFLDAAVVAHEILPPELNNWNDEDYYSYQEVYNILSTVSNVFPEIASMESLGVSTRDSVTIWGLKISDNPDLQEDEPDALIDAVIHAREPVNVNICVALIDSLITLYGIDPSITNLVDNTEIWIVPIKNPEGYLYVETGISYPWWRKNKRDNNLNGLFDGVLDDYCVADEYPSYPDGVDLNRNYNAGWNNAGSPDSCSIVYRGPSAFSENETSMERNLVGREHIVASICFHSYSEYVGYCGMDLAGYDLCRDIAGAILKEDGFSSYDPSFFFGSGQSYNWMYWEYGVQGFLIETATEFMPSGESRINSIVQNNINGIFALLNRIHGSSIRGNVFDSETEEPLVAEVVVEGEPVLYEPRMSEPEHGRFLRLVRSGTYTLHVSRDGYDNFTMPDVIVEEGVPTVVEIPLVESTTDAQEEEPAGHVKVKTFSLSQNYPNPFNPSTTLSYSIPETAGPVDVEVTVYNVRGRMIRKLVDGKMESGTYQAHWDGRDCRGESVPSGIYLYRIRAGDFRDIRKMVMAR